MKTKETKTRSIIPFVAAIAIAFILLAGLQIVLAPAPVVVAAPLAAPTPIANIPGDSGRSLHINFQSALSMSTDTNTSSRLVQGYEYLDAQYVAAQDDGNRLTITIQFSNDDSNWVDGPILANFASGSADRTDISRFQLFGRYVRFAQTMEVDNAVPVTITIIGLAK